MDLPRLVRGVENKRKVRGTSAHVVGGFHQRSADGLSRRSTERILDSPTVSGADTFYNVFAHTTDNRRVLIARAVNSQHAHFIAQELQAYLDQPSEAEQDALFTSEDDAETDDLTFDTGIGAHRAQR